MSEAAKSLTDQWALITGAAKRIGATVARRLHREGANVAVHYFRSSEPAEALARELNALRPDSAMTVGADIRRTSEIPDLVEKQIEVTA